MSAQPHANASAAAAASFKSAWLQESGTEIPMHDPSAFVGTNHNATLELRNGTRRPEIRQDGQKEIVKSLLYIVSAASGLGERCLVCAS
jgi:hypothetical protein